jgi:molybdopterin converting factor small subunit
VLALLEAGRLRPVFLYERVPTTRVPEADLRAVDPDLATLANLNTPSDYASTVPGSEFPGFQPAPPEAAGPSRPRVRIELYEGARQRAGVTEVIVEAATLGEALLELERAAPGLAPEVVAGGRLAPHWRASVNGRRFVEDPATPLADGDALLLLSALAGG